MKSQATTGNAATLGTKQRPAAGNNLIKLVQFYRATLYVSAVFAVAPYLYLFVCLSVCLSVTFVNYIQSARDIVKLLSRLDSPSFQFLTPSAGAQFQGNLFSGN